MYHVLGNTGKWNFSNQIDDVALYSPTNSFKNVFHSTLDYIKGAATHEDPARSKSIAIYVVGPSGGALPRPVPLLLCGEPLPWVERAAHLGHALHQDGTMRQDCREKRAIFVDTSVKLRETFSFAHPAEIITATAKYCKVAYGSNLWDYSTPEFRMMCNAWTTGHKLRSSLGSNLELVRNETGLNPWAVGQAELRAKRDTAHRAEIPDVDHWRVPALQKLLEARLAAHYTADKVEEKRLLGLIDSLVIN